MSDPGLESQAKWHQHTQGCSGTNTEGAQGLLSQDLTSRDSLSGSPTLHPAQMESP